MSSTNKERLDNALNRFRSHPVISKFRQFMTEAPDDELFHINPTQLAETWNASRRTVLELLLRAVRFGLLGMEWVFHCPTCGGVAKESLQLAHTHEQDFCPVCRVDFRNTLDENVEVVFSVNPEIRKIPEALKEEYEKRIVEDITTGGRHDWYSSGTVEGVEVLNHPVFRDIFGIDYFGRTVNIAARAQAVSGPGQLSMGETFIRAPGVKEALQERVSRVRRGRVTMKGIRETVLVYRVPLN